MSVLGSPISRRSVLRAGGVVAAGAAVGVSLTESAQAAPGGVPAAQVAQAEPAAGPPWHATLSVKQQVGQRVIFSYPGPMPPDELVDWIRSGTVGGLIFFGENIPSLAHIADVVTELRRAHAQSPTASSPLLFMTDQEGGYIRRLRGQQPVLSEKAIGLSADPVAQATIAGAGAGAALRAVGMNLNLAPVQDVFREPGNFDDQWARSYSSDPAVCSMLGAAMVRAQQATGVAATAKHFPGLGAATRDQNTDLGPVVLTQSAQEIRAVDEDAFVGPIGAGVDLVMTSWARYPAIDAAFPAGLSRRFVEGELRDRLHFRGVTITDALEAGAIASFGGTGERAVLAAEAGMDLILCSGRDVQQGIDAVDAMTAAVQKQRLNPGHFVIALRRVRRLRDRLF